MNWCSIDINFWIAKKKFDNFNIPFFNCIC